MATIVQTVPSPTTLVKTVVETTLTGTADTFTYVPNSGQIMILRNPTGSAITGAKLLGSLAGLVTVAGAEPKDCSAGFPVGSVPAGASRLMQLDKIASYLVGNCSVTAGTGLVAVLADGG